MPPMPPASTAITPSGDTWISRSSANYWAHVVSRSENPSIDIEVVPGNDLTLIEVANLFQQLLLTACVPALLCTRLVATGITAMIEDQQSRLCFVRDLSKLSRRGMNMLAVLLPFC